MEKANYYSELRLLRQHVPDRLGYYSSLVVGMTLPQKKD